MSQPEYPGAIGMFVDESRVFIDQNTHFAVVIHKTACGAPCTAQDVANFFASDPNKASTHFVVGQDGAVVQCVLLKDGSGGNCCVEPGYDSFWNSFVAAGTNLNTVTISIEHCDPTTDNSTALTEQQKTASFNLVNWLCQRFNIPPSNIKTHASIDPSSRKNCPGNYPMDELIAYIQNGGGTTGVPTGWNDDGTTLTAPNGHKVVMGFRSFILSNSWNPANVPLEEEVQLNPLEESNRALGSGSQQVFDMTTLEWTQDRGVFVAYVGQEFMFVRNDRNNLRVQNTQLQNKITQLQSGLPKADIQTTVADLNNLSNELNAMIT